MVVLDAENLHGNPKVEPLQLARELRIATRTLGITRRDLVIAGMSTFAASRCEFVLPTHQIAVVLGKGPDGADEALIAATDLPRLSKEFGTLIVISNDHRFAELAHQARSLGMRTWMVSSDLSRVGAKTIAAYDGHTRLKLSVLRKRLEEKDHDRELEHIRRRKAA